jgi:hypothetical protein
VKTPLWNPPEYDGIELRHYTERLAENPDWLALREGLVARRDELVTRLVGRASDAASIETIHALRGQIRMCQEILDHPDREARRYQEKQTP